MKPNLLKIWIDDRRNSLPITDDRLAICVDFDNGRHYMAEIARPRDRDSVALALHGLADMIGRDPLLVGAIDKGTPADHRAENNHYYRELKMKKTFIALVAIGIAFGGPSEGSETTTKVGTWRNYSGGGIVFSVTDINGSKSAVVFSADKYVVKTNYFRVDKRDLEQIRALIDETIAILDEGSKEAATAVK